jgi:hypothetical protein
MSDRLAELEHEAAAGRGADLGEAHSLIDLLARTPKAQRGEIRRRLKARILGLVREARVLVVRRGADRLCAAQFHFRAGGRRDYVIYYRGARRHRNGGWDVWSLADVIKAGDIDLRDRADATALEAELLDLDLGELDATALE